MQPVILLLGGTAESKQLAQLMSEKPCKVIYSIAGLARFPQLQCEVHYGGFSDHQTDGISGLAQYCTARKVSLLIDATHPYAGQISQHAVEASKRTAIPCWRLERPGWNPADYPNWHDYDDLEDLLKLTQSFHRPFYSIGQSAANFAHRRPSHQQWVVRSARPFQPQPGIIQINDIGPFSFEQELELMKKHQVDALISKNSGCSRVMAKIDAAHALDLPVFVQRRPLLPAVQRSFAQMEQLLDAIEPVIAAQIA